MTNPNGIPADLLDTLNALDHVVCAQSGALAWTRIELDALFGRVAPADNWKHRIDATVTLANDHELIGTREAVIFFTGSVPTMTALGNNRYRVRAAGYYATIGA